MTSLLDYAANLDGEDDIHLNTFYNVIGQDFLNQIIAECNIFSFKKILKPSIIHNVRRFIYKYNKHLYRTIEEYNEDIENIETRVQSQIDNIEEVMFNIDNFDQNILEEIYQYSVQYHDMYEYYKDKIVNKLIFVIKNEQRRNTFLGNFGGLDYGLTTTSLLNNLFGDNLPNLPNLEDLEEKENRDYDTDLVRTLSTQNIFEIEKSLFFNEEMMLLDDFLIYLFSHLFDYFEYNSFPNLNGKQIIYLLIIEYIEICEKLNIKITTEQYNFFNDKLNEIKVPKNKIIYTKIIILMENLTEYLIDEKNNHIDYKYFLENGRIEPDIIDILYNLKKITPDMLKDALKIEKYYQNLTDIQIIKYKDYIDISELITKRMCSIDLIEKLSDKFTGLDWQYIFKNYNNLNDSFLIENKDKLLLFIYKNIQLQN